MSLFRRIVLLNAVVLIVATVPLLLAPATVSTPVLLTETLILTGELAAVLVVNAALLRVGLVPLGQLNAMTATDLPHPGPRPAVAGHSGIAGRIETFNGMLDRLEAERGASTTRALSEQEADRRRIAQEPHDQVGLTQPRSCWSLKRVADHAPSSILEELFRVRETTRESLDEIRQIARRLRPGVPDELGLISALKALTTEVGCGADCPRRRPWARPRHRGSGDWACVNAPCSSAPSSTSIPVRRVAPRSACGWPTRSPSRDV